MTDKQIIQYKKECFEEPYCSLREVLEELSRKEQECEELKEKLSRKKAVIDFASCPSYGYRDNDIEPTCTKTFCYDVESCEYKTTVKYKQALIEIKEITEQGVKIHDDIIVNKQILQKCEVLDE